MDDLLWVMAWVGAAGFLAYEMFMWWLDREAQQMLAEFERDFPLDCPLCAYHRYGIMHGHCTGQPESHLGRGKRGYENVHTDEVLRG